MFKKKCKHTTDNTFILKTSDIHRREKNISKQKLAIRRSSERQ